MSIQIFISYAREDLSVCDQIREVLSGLGLSLFRDIEGLKGGEDWNRHILNFAKSSSYFVFLASSSSVEKPGMIQQELAIAQAKLTLDDSFKFLAIRLDDTPLPEWMKSRQYLNFDDPELFDKVVSSLNDHLNQESATIKPVGGHAFVNMNPESVEYSTDGCDYEYTVPTFATIGAPHVSIELNALVRGRVSERVLKMRGWVEPNPPDFEHSRSMIAVHPVSVMNSRRMISILFEHFAHFSGAAHPQHNFFALNILRSPWSFFDPIIRPENKQEFVHLIVDELEKEEGMWDEGELRESLVSFDFSDHMLVGDDSIKIAFPDYSIACYAYGPSIHEFRNPDVLALIEEH